jgi:hypothetical protein
LGFRLADSATLVDWQRRLELAGISTKREEGVECCYARQTKFWVHDPDGNLWEVYTLEEDLDHRGDGRLPVTAPPDRELDGPAPAIWAHRLGEPFPPRLAVLDGTVDRVVLEGTFNERLSPEEQHRRLLEVRRVLKVDGVVQLHMLTSDRPLGTRAISLPGPAAAVQAVPAESELLATLAECGFSDVTPTFRGQSPCFVIGDCELRETRLDARS